MSTNNDAEMDYYTAEEIAERKRKRKMYNDRYRSTAKGQQTTRACQKRIDAKLKESEKRVAITVQKNVVEAGRADCEGECEVMSCEDCKWFYALTDDWPQWKVHPYLELSGSVALSNRAESLRLNRRPSAEQTAACIVSGGTAGRVLRLVRTPRTVPPLEVLSGPSALPSRAESLRLNRLRASADMEGGRARCVLVDIDAAASSRRASSATTSQGTTTEFMTHANASTYTSTVAHVLCGMRGNS